MSYLAKDFGEWSDVLLDQWPEMIDQWMDEGSLIFKNFGCLTFRDAKFFRNLVKEGKKKRESLKAIQPNWKDVEIQTTASLSMQNAISQTSDVVQTTNNRRVSISSEWSRNVRVTYGP